MADHFSWHKFSLVSVQDGCAGLSRALEGNFGLGDASGIYLVPSLPVGSYRVEVKSTGVQTIVAIGVELSVGSSVRQDFELKVATTSEAVEVWAAAPLIDLSTSTLGSVVDQHTVQEIPLNGRHFIDLALLTAGTVTPPANGFLTAPLRGQGSFSFNSAGAREDSVNFMINGINLNDPNQNQITFQPAINTVAEFKIDNSTFSAEYGRSSGSIVNIATRSGVNVWHGEAYEFLRNAFFDARNYGNPSNVVVSNSLVHSPENQFVRNQFGGDGGGAIVKSKVFAYLSYEQLRQRQAVALTATVLTAAQRSQVSALSDAAVRALDNTDSASAYHINSGVTGAIGLPHITGTGAFAFGGDSGFPQGRGDNVGTLSDTLSWVRGNHIVKVGGEFRRQNSDNFSATPGTFSFASIADFIADQGNSFSVTNSNRSNRSYVSSFGAFVTDTWKLEPTFTVTLGLRYDWYCTPTEAENRYVVFDPKSGRLRPAQSPQFHEPGAHSGQYRRQHLFRGGYSRRDYGWHTHPLRRFRQFPANPDRLEAAVLV
jgi:hypothetical protein